MSLIRLILWLKLSSRQEAGGGRGAREGLFCEGPQALLWLQWELVLVSVLSLLFRNILLLGFLQQKKNGDLFFFLKF